MKPCLRELLIIDNNEGPELVRDPNGTEEGKISNEDDEGFILIVILNHLVSLERMR